MESCETDKAHDALTRQNSVSVDARLGSGCPKLTRQTPRFSISRINAFAALHISPICAPSIHVHIYPDALQLRCQEAMRRKVKIGDSCAYIWEHFVTSHRGVKKSTYILFALWATATVLPHHRAMTDIAKRPSQHARLDSGDMRAVQTVGTWRFGQ